LSDSRHFDDVTSHSRLFQVLHRITTKIRMFADDTKIWNQIVDSEDVDKLQKDLDSIVVVSYVVTAVQPREVCGDAWVLYR